MLDVVGVSRPRPGQQTYSGLMSTQVLVLDVVGVSVRSGLTRWRGPVYGSL